MNFRFSRAAVVTSGSEHWFMSRESKASRLPEQDAMKSKESSASDSKPALPKSQSTETAASEKKEEPTTPKRTGWVGGALT